ncbi:hypothetical protein MMC08_000332 [Hypocenomyce scalaris]|nr:hypothetical protein [Hypocenomyce scalaris]
METALERLKDLLRAGMYPYEAGLFDTLESIAHGFSCDHHRTKAEDLARLTYYWLALDSLPSLLTCMGIVDSPLIAAPVDMRQIQLDVDDLDSARFWIVYEAVGKLDRRWWNCKETVNVAECFKGMLKARLTSDLLDKDKKGKMEDARQRWKICHQLEEISGEETGLPSQQARTTAEDKDQPSENSDGSISENDSELTQSGAADVGLVREQNNDSPAREVSVRSSARRKSVPASATSRGAPVTPKRPTNPKSPASAPTTPQKRDPRESTIVHRNGTSSAPRPQQKPLGHSASRGSPTSSFTRSTQSPHFDRRDDETSDGSEAHGMKGKRPNQRPLSQHDKGPQMEAQAEDLLPCSGIRSLPLVSSSPDTNIGRQNKIALGSETNTNNSPNAQSLTKAAPTPENFPRPTSAEYGGANGSVPFFEPFDKSPEGVIATVNKVFELMQKPLSKNNADEGCIYALYMPECPGYIKIGRTVKNIKSRKTGIQKCTKQRLELLNHEDHCKVPNHTTVEALIHAELRLYRSCFRCKCRVPNLIHCEGDDGVVTHGEWFEIDKAKALEVVRRWRKWMTEEPHCNGLLRVREELRIRSYSKNSHRLKSLISKDDKGNEIWRWDVFMRCSQWQFQLLQLRSWFRDRRFNKGTNDWSRWDSLCESWESNLLLYLAFFVFSTFLFAVADFLPPVFPFTSVLVVMNSAFLGTFAILYAA